MKHDCIVPSSPVRIAPPPPPATHLKAGGQETPATPINTTLPTDLTGHITCLTGCPSNRLSQQMSQPGLLFYDCMTQVDGEWDH